MSGTSSFGGGATYLTGTKTAQLATGSVSGPVISGYSGPGSYVLLGTFAAVTPTTGLASGTGGTGTTSTSLVKPNGSANWTANDFRDKLLRITSGGGASGDPNIPTIRAIKSNSTTAIVVDAVSGMDETTVFDIVLPNTTLTGGTLTITGNTAPITIVGCTIDASTYSYGAYSARNSGGVRFHGCKFATNGTVNSVYSTDDSCHVQITGSLFSGGASVSILYASRASVTQCRMNAAAGITIDYTHTVTAILDAVSSTSNTLSVKRANNLTLTLAASSCAATPCVLQTVGNVDIVSLTGSSNTGYGVDVSKGGVYNLAGATITGATGDFVVDGIANASVTWAETSSYGALTRWGSTILITGGANTTRQMDTARIEGNLDVPAAGYVSGTGGTLQLGGRVLNYGYFHLTQNDALTAHAGGGQGSATALGYGANVITTCATSGDSALLPSGAVVGGNVVHVKNLGAASCNVFPPSGGKINALATNAAFAVAAASSAFFISRSDGSGGLDWVTG